MHESVSDGKIEGATASEKINATLVPKDKKIKINL